MKNLFSIGVLFLSLNGYAGGHDPRAILALLKASKVSLLQGIDLAEKLSGPATSAKFEVGDDGKLALSVYTVPEGLAVEAEKATLTELSGDPTAQSVALNAEVFADKEHIARASVHLALAQLSNFSLRQVVERAQKLGSGIAIDVRNPMVRAKRPVADVITYEKRSDTFYVVTVDLQTGDVESKLLQ